MGIIYIATNSINGKQYVGQTRQRTRRRIIGHVHDSKNGRTPFCRAVKKYGIKAFSFQEIDCPNDELDRIEIETISRLNTKTPNGYHLTNGGQGTQGRSYTMSEEHKAKIANGRTGKRHSEETKTMLKTMKLGKKMPPFSEEHRSNMSSASLTSWKKRFKSYIFTSPDGTEHTSKNGFRRFCEEHGIRRDMMYRVLAGKVEQGNHRGWTVREVPELVGA